MTYVVLLRGRIASIFSWIIAIGTNSQYTHGIIIHKGVGYDASESRGNVGKSRPLNQYGSRKVLVYKVNTKSVDVQRYINGKLNKKYDWKGIFGWIFRKQDKNKFYCFEFVWELLLKVGATSKQRNRVGARHICDVLDGREVFEGRARDFKPEK